MTTPENRLDKGHYREPKKIYSTVRNQIQCQNTGDKEDQSMDPNEKLLLSLTNRTKSREKNIENMEI